MLTLLWALFGLAALLLGLLVLALATPIHLAVTAECDDGAARFLLRLRLFGGATPWLRLVDTARTVGGLRPESSASGWRGKNKDKTRNKAARSGFRGRFGKRLAKGAGWRLLRALPQFVKRELRRIHLDRLSVEGNLGLGDPADTGRLFGYLMPLNHALRLPRARIDLRPDFTRLRCDGRAEAALRLVPLALLIPLAQLGWRVYVARG